MWQPPGVGGTFTLRRAAGEGARAFRVDDGCIHAAAAGARGLRIGGTWLNASSSSSSHTRSAGSSVPPCAFSSVRILGSLRRVDGVARRIDESVRIGAVREQQLDELPGLPAGSDMQRRASWGVIGVGPCRVGATLEEESHNRVMSELHSRTQRTTEVWPGELNSRWIFVEECGHTREVAECGGNHEVDDAPLDRAAGARSADEGTWPGLRNGFVRHQRANLHAFSQVES